MQSAKRARCVAAVKPLAGDEAAQTMWLYYRDHKAQLVSHVREYREAILRELVAGVSVEAVFAPYFKPVDRVKPARRSA